MFACRVAHGKAQLPDHLPILEQLSGKKYKKMEFLGPPVNKLVSSSVDLEVKKTHAGKLPVVIKKQFTLPPKVPQALGRKHNFVFNISLSYF